MAPRTSEGRTIPVRDLSREAAASANGPVVTYKLSPEELERYRAQTSRPRDENGKLRSRPIPTTQEVSEMSTNTAMTKEKYLEERLSGKSRTAIQRESEINPAKFYAMLGEWDIKEMDKELALLETMRSNKEAASSSVEAFPPMPTGTRRMSESEFQQQMEIEKLQSELQKARIDYDELKEKLEEERTSSDEALRLLNETKRRLNELQFKSPDLTLNDYQALASRTANTDWERIAVKLIREPQLLPLLNFALGAAGEAGEIADEIKKVVFHGHEFNADKLVKEIGDALWYLSQLANVVGVPFESIAERNIEKLKQRYPEGFSEERSQKRVDAQ